MAPEDGSTSASSIEPSLLEPIAVARELLLKATKLAIAKTSCNHAHAILNVLDTKEKVLRDQDPLCWIDKLIVQAYLDNKSVSSNFEQALLEVAQNEQLGLF